MCATLLAAAGEPDVAEKLLKGHKAIGAATTRCTSTATTSCPRSRARRAWPRKDFIYWTDDGSVAALRYGNWKISFLKQPAARPARLDQPFEELRAPMLTNLRMDPFELAQDIGMDYGRWFVEHMFAVRAGRRLRRPVAAELPEFPPRQKPAASTSTA